VEVNVAALEALLNRQHVRGLVEQVFAGLEGAAGVNVVPDYEGVFASNDAGGLEFDGDAAGRVPGVEHHKHLPGRLARRQNGPSEPYRGSKGGDQEEPDNLSHGIPKYLYLQEDRDSLDEEGIRCI
jgi:hypothetical protein